MGDGSSSELDYEVETLMKSQMLNTTVASAVGSNVICVQNSRSFVQSERKIPTIEVCDNELEDGEIIEIGSVSRTEESKPVNPKKKMQLVIRMKPEMQTNEAKSAMIKSDIPCRFFKFGKCMYGESCRFRHVYDTVYSLHRFENNSDLSPMMTDVPYETYNDQFKQPLEDMESAWEKGLERAKMLLDLAMIRKMVEVEKIRNATKLHLHEKEKNALPQPTNTQKEIAGNENFKNDSFKRKITRQYDPWRKSKKKRRLAPGSRSPSSHSGSSSSVKRIRDKKYKSKKTCEKHKLKKSHLRRRSSSRSSSDRSRSPSKVTYSRQTPKNSLQNGRRLPLLSIGQKEKYKKESMKYKVKGISRQSYCASYSENSSSSSSSDSYEEHIISSKKSCKKFHVKNKDGNNKNKNLACDSLSLKQTLRNKSDLREYLSKKLEHKSTEKNRKRADSSEKSLLKNTKLKRASRPSPIVSSAKKNCETIDSSDESLVKKIKLKRSHSTPKVCIMKKNRERVNTSEKSILRKTKLKISSSSSPKVSVKSEVSRAAISQKMASPRSKIMRFRDSLKITSESKGYPSLQDSFHVPSKAESLLSARRGNWNSVQATSPEPRVSARRESWDNWKIASPESKVSAKRENWDNWKITSPEPKAPARRENWSWQKREDNWNSQKKEESWSPQKKEDSWSPQKKKDSWSPQKKKDSWSPQKKKDSWNSQRKENSWSPQKKKDSWISQKKENNWNSQKKEDNWNPQKRGGNWNSWKSASPEPKVSARTENWNPQKRGGNWNSWKKASPEPNASAGRESWNSQKRENWNPRKRASPEARAPVRRVNWNSSLVESPERKVRENWNPPKMDSPESNVFVSDAPEVRNEESLVPKVRDSFKVAKVDPKVAARREKWRKRLEAIEAKAEKVD